MKQKDIALIVVVVFFSAIMSFLLTNWVIAKPDSRRAKVEVVDPIVAEFKSPDIKYFNANSVNPTKLIQIQDNQNESPFGGN